MRSELQLGLPFAVAVPVPIACAVVVQGRIEKGGRGSLGRLEGFGRLSADIGLWRLRLRGCTPKACALGASADVCSVLPPPGNGRWGWRGR